MWEQIGFADVIDIAFIALFLYLILVWFKRTRAAFVLAGIVIMGAIYLLAQQFDLKLTAGVLQGFFAVILLALVIIFQEEIRRFFERVAVWSMNPRLRGRHRHKPTRDENEALVRTIIDLARERIGVLIALRGRQLIDGYLDGGTELGGRVSEALLKSLFDPHSIGHDGAVVMEGARVVRFGVHLPLSKNFQQLAHHGTRHAAALGLAEVTDAFCLIVSEENGGISIARNGKLRMVGGADELLARLERFADEIAPHARKRSWTSWIFTNSREKAIALAMAALLWFVHVYGSAVIYRTFDVPVKLVEMPEGLDLATVTPSDVNVTFSGPRSKLYFLNRNQVQLVLKTLSLRSGAQTIRITPSDLSFPQKITLEAIDPTRIKIDIERTDPKESDE